MPGIQGNKGFMEAIAGPFEIDWSQEGLDRPAKTIVKKYNAEIHSQSAIEALLELKQEHNFRPADVKEIELEIFDVAYKIIGGGEEGDKTTLRTKEQADHSLAYILSVALLDGRVMPEQLSPGTNSSRRCPESFAPRERPSGRRSQPPLPPGDALPFERPIT